MPGNARELENVVERTLNLAPGPLIRAEDLPSYLSVSPGPVPVFSGPAAPAAPPPAAAATLQSHEARALSETLARCHGNIRAAAAALGISRSALYAKLARLGIDYQTFRRC